MRKNIEKIQEQFKNNIFSIVVFIIAISIMFLVYFIGDFNDMKLDQDSAYNLLTVNTIFTGFLYSMLGNMVEFSTRPEIAERDKAGYIDKYFSPVYFGLLFFLLSILLDILMIFFNFHWKQYIFLYVSRGFSVVGVVYFIISSWMLQKTISTLRGK